MDFSVDPGSLHAAGRTLAATGADAADLARRHRSAGADDAAAWGSGAVARLGAVHRDLLAATGEALDLLAAVLDRGGTHLARMGETYAMADADVDAALTRIRTGLP